ncbi:MAG: bacteriohemerythrin [Sterolibacterium sp.]|nr:bacteriohemerythrin [Sterolibacterium sp.]
MEWKYEHSIGIQEIDDQHRKLIEIIVSIERAIVSHVGWRDIVYGLVDLKVFARSHFEIEEALMRMYGYKEAAKHTEEHQYFFTRLAEIECKSIDKLAEGELLKFLRDWLKKHILGEDRGYADHILAGASIVKTKVPSLTVVKSAG